MSGCLEINSVKLPGTGTLTAKARQTTCYMEYPILNLSSPRLQRWNAFRYWSHSVPSCKSETSMSMKHTTTSKIILKNELQDIWGDIGNFCSDWYGMAKTTVRKANIEPSMPRVVGRQQRRSNVEAGTPKDYYKRALTIPSIDSKRDFNRLVESSGRIATSRLSCQQTFQKKPLGAMCFVMA